MLIVVDFGTEFAIEVVGERSSEVHVFKGKLKCAQKSRMLRLSGTSVANQATRIDHATFIPLGISIDDHRFLRNLNEPDQTYSGRFVNSYHYLTIAWLSSTMGKL